MSLPNVIAIVAVLTCTVAALGNAWYIYRYRPYGTMMALSLGFILALIWTIAGYAFLLLDTFPDLDPPVNVIMLRPALAGFGFLLAFLPAGLASSQQKYSNHDDLKERISRANHYRNEALDCQERLKTVEQTNIFLLDLNDRRRREEVELKAQIVELKTQIMQSRMGGDSS